MSREDALANGREREDVVVDGDGRRSGDVRPREDAVVDGDGWEL